MNDINFNTYQSVFSWRYASEEMRFIFSEQHKYELWRKIWVALAEAEMKAGLVSEKELADLKKHEKDIDISRILEIEKETKHDVVAAIREFAEKAKTGGGKIHLGATSMDVVDNADTLRLHEAMKIIEKKVIAILDILAEKIEIYADVPCLGFTHLQPAEPTTVGYRLAFYAQDLLLDLQQIYFVKSVLKGKGFKGAVGTGASYVSLLNVSGKRGTSASRISGKLDSGVTSFPRMTRANFEEQIMSSLGLDSVTISTQVSPRKLDYFVLNVLNGIASSMAKFAGDLRILQSPMYGEWSEPFGKNQVGSSAMPFKKNPLNSEKICSLARYVNALPQVALENASLSYLERTLDDSANKRIIMSNGFLAVDEILLTAKKIMSGLIINEKRITFNLQHYSPFSATESILLSAVKKNANRQELHEVLRDISLIAWNEIQEGKENPMKRLLRNNPVLKRYLDEEEIDKSFDMTHHIGDAPERARTIAKEIRKLKHP